ncbi:MAG: hypothetical protein GWM87_01450 [Xanthomonadales bacterium]|nr:hypothetical protein [Xanthomonadales bacterium]NIX11748.1 hypothetical protein [Xanthomonadales bacterium]
MSARKIMAICCSVAIFGFTAVAMAQEPETEATLPTVEGIAHWLAAGEPDPDALLTIAVLARLQRQLQQARPLASADDLRQDRAWLERLVERYGSFRPHGTVLDPAAWLVRLKLDQNGLQPTELVLPGGPGLHVHVDQVFSRSGERLAAAALPELMWMVEPQATVIWNSLAERAAADEALHGLLAEIARDWIPADAGERVAPDVETVLATVSGSLSVYAESTVFSGPPDGARLREARFQLLAAMPALDERARSEATDLLHIAAMLDGLHERRFFAFTEGLLSVTSGILSRAGTHPGTPSEAGLWLLDALPAISASYARMFSGTDPRLNSAVAAAFDVLQNVSRPEADPARFRALLGELGDAVAQLALLIPDLDYYFGLPVRDTIAGDVDTCTAMMASADGDISPAMTRELFNDCQESLVNLADDEARQPGISGDSDGPFGPVHLQRELSVTSGQRINYGIGFLHDRYSTGCEEPSRPLPNPLEWATLATLMAWFAEQSPVYFQAPENEARLSRMRAIGMDLLQTIAEQVDCFSGAGASLNDPVSRSLVDYHEGLVELTGGLAGAVGAFRGQVLKPGADIALQMDAAQPTAYRPGDLSIGPCDPERVCEMSGPLSSTRALLGLFPDTYLVADQAGFGQIEICYRNLEWINRRSEFVRADDTNVANYYGMLAFDLVGRHVVDGAATGIFGFRFTSPNEHHYLFAAATEEVLADSCPVEWIGSRIVTPLREGRSGVVPNRLTYLAAPRMLPSRLLSANWDRGAEWRDWFITGIGVERLPIEPDNDISPEVTQYLQSLYRAEQAAVYESMLEPADRASADMGIESQFERVTLLSTAKAMIRTQITLFYPQVLIQSDEIRSAVAGHAGLLDRDMLERFRQAGIPVAAIEDRAFGQLERFQAAWRDQAEATLRTGSVAASVAHALMRLNALYQEYFAPPAGGGGIQLLSQARADPAD